MFSTSKVNVSGTSVTTYRDLSIDMKIGDTVTITYSKDSSSSSGSDCAWVKLITEAQEKLVTEKLVKLTPDNVAKFATCNDDVVCTVCSKVVMNKLGHELIEHAAKELLKGEVVGVQSK